MRFILKYKHLSSKKKLIDTPIRVLKFKHSKWRFRKNCLRCYRRLRFFLFPKQKSRGNRKKFISNSSDHVGFNKYHSILHVTNRPKSSNGFLPSLKVSPSKSYNNLNVANSKLNYSKKNLTSFIKTLNFRNKKLHKSAIRWKKFKFFYKNSLEQQKSYRQLLDNRLLFRNLKKNLFYFFDVSNYEGFYRSLMQFEFRLDILLYRLRYFKTTGEAIIHINNQLIKVNSKAVQGNFILKSGDVILFDKRINLASNLKCIKKSISIKRFVEIDHYSNTIVVLSSINDIHSDDFLNFTQRPFNLNKFAFSFK